MAAPVLVAAVTGSDAKSTISKEYGGKGIDEAAAKANPVYNAIGQVNQHMASCTSDTRPCCTLISFPYSMSALLS